MKLYTTFYSFLLFFQGWIIPDLSDHNYNAFVLEDSRGCVWISSTNAWNRYCGDDVISFTPFNTSMPNDYIQSNLIEVKSDIFYFTLTDQLCVINAIDETVICDKISFDGTQEYVDYQAFGLNSEENLRLLVSGMILDHDRFSKNSNLIVDSTLCRVFSTDVDNMIVCAPWIQGKGIEVIHTESGIHYSIENVIDDMGVILSPTVFSVFAIDIKSVYGVSDLGLIVYDLNLKTGHLINKNSFYSASKSKNKIFLLSTNGEVFMFDIESGKLHELPHYSKFCRDDCRDIFALDERVLLTRKLKAPILVSEQSINVMEVVTNASISLVELFNDKLTYISSNKLTIGSQEEVDLFNNAKFRNSKVFSGKMYFNYGSGLIKIDERTEQYLDMPQGETIIDFALINDTIQVFTHNNTYQLIDEEFVQMEAVECATSHTYRKLQKDGIYTVDENSNGYYCVADTIHELDIDGYVYRLQCFKDKIYFSTASNLYECNADSCHPIIPLEFEISNIYGVKVHDDNLWFTSSDGLYVYSDSLTRINLPKDAQLIECPPVIIDENVYVGTSEGILTVSTAYQSSLIAPKLFGFRILVDSDTMEYSNFIDMEYGAESITIEYLITDFTNSGKPKLEYYLNGKRNLVASRIIELQSLTPGTYNITVRAINGQLTKSRTAEVTLTVHPPYYQTWWFRSLCVLGLLGIGFLISYIRTRQLLRRQQIEIDRQNALQAQRNRMSQDLHDEMGSGLSAIKHISASSSSTDKDDQIETIATGLIRSMRDLLWSLDESHDTLFSLTVKIRQTVHQLLRNSGIEPKITVQLEDENQEISGPSRRHIILMLKEVINNTIKHAEATKLDIMISSTHRDLRLSIRDNGVGFDTGQEYAGYGLKSIGKRAKDMGATIEINSTEEGIHIELIKPIVH